MHIKLLPNSKIPPRGQQILSDDPQVIGEWIESGFNVGEMMDGIVVVDFDGVGHRNGKGPAREFFKKYKKLFGELPHNILETPSDGIHFRFEGETKTRKILNENGDEEGDLKSSGYCLIPPSIVGRPYRWISQGPLQNFPEIMFPIIQDTRAQTATVINEDDPVRRLIRAREWMKKREGKEDGNGRGLQTIKTCRKLFAYYGLTEGEVWALMIEYNERCQLGYTVEDLQHKIIDSQKGLP